MSSHEHDLLFTTTSFKVEIRKLNDTLCAQITTSPWESALCAQGGINYEDLCNAIIHARCVNGCVTIVKSATESLQLHNVAHQDHDSRCVPGAMRVTFRIDTVCNKGLDC
jgi:hypothetical protein